MARAAKQGERDAEAIFNGALLSALPDGVITYAADGQCRSANRAATGLLGVPLERLLTQNFREISSWRDSGLLARAEETLRTGGSQQWETYFTSTAGKRLWLQFRLERVDLAGKLTLILILTDISERKQMEESLRLTQFSVDHAADFVHWLDPDGRIISANESSCRRYGYSRQEMLGLTIFDLDPALSPESWPDRWQKIRQGRASTLEAVHRTKTGELFPVEVTRNYVQYGGREYDVAFVRDITERRQTEETLQLTQFSVDHVADSVFWTDSGGRLIFVSESTCRRHGYARDELLAMTLFDLDPSLSREQWAENWKRIKEQGTLNFETVHESKLGEIFPVEVSANYVQFKDAEYNCVFARDITDRKGTEEALRLTQLSIDRAGNLIQWLAPMGACSTRANRLADGSATLVTRFSARPSSSLDPGMSPETWPEHWRAFEERLTCDL